VDTAVAERSVDFTDEVAGGCFCCLFDTFTLAAERLAAHEPQVIFAEPVGSCTDLVATVMRPLQDLYGSAYRTAPYTVLIDPQMAARYWQDASDVGYLFRKQVEEADLVCFTKSDLGAVAQTLQIDKPTRALSAKTGEKVEAWLDEVSSGVFRAGRRILDLDYARYARAEAALGWLNASIDVIREPAASPSLVVGPLMDEIVRLLDESSITVAHFKVSDQTASGFIKAAICRNGDEPDVEGDRMAGGEKEHRIVLNLRAAGAPETMEHAVRAAVDAMPGKAVIAQLSAFRPAEPRPTHRYTAASN
jgi:hypothetical protein